MPTKVAIVGATGYVGGELARLALGHPEITLVAAIARSRQGEPLRAVQPPLPSAPESLVVGSDVGDAEVVFTALPAGEAAKQAQGWIDEGRAVVDIGSDFRLRDAALYERWYGYAHPAPALLAEAVYGLTEFARERLRGARLVANPGCYPTASLLPLAPALAAQPRPQDLLLGPHVRRVALRARDGVMSGEEGDARQQLVPRARGGRRAERAARGLRGPRQPRERRGRLGAPELQRHARLPGDDGARGAPALAM